MNSKGERVHPHEPNRFPSYTSDGKRQKMPSDFPENTVLSGLGGLVRPIPLVHVLSLSLDAVLFGADLHLSRLSHAFLNSEEEFIHIFSSKLT